MRTKALYLAAAFCAAGLATASAQTFSLNVAGYVNKTIPSGFSMIANPLNAPTNTLAAVIPTAPNFSQFLSWNGTGFQIATFTFGSWGAGANTPLAPGQGGFINTSAQFTNTFVGEVMQGSLSNAIPAGFSIKGSQVPQAANIIDLDLSDDLANFSQVLKWNGAGYDTFTKTFGNWSPSTPTIGVAEAVFINTSTATAWQRNFTVN